MYSRRQDFPRAVKDCERQEIYGAVEHGESEHEGANPEIKKKQPAADAAGIVK